MPDNMSFKEGAAVEPATVSLHGIMQVGITAGDKVAVLGCGPIGAFSITFAKLLGATEVYAVDIDPKKFSAAMSMGADRCIDAAKEDTVEALLKITDNKGFDVVVETAGSHITQEQSLRLAKKKGKVLFLGTAHRDVVFPPATFERIVRDELWVTGAWNSFSAPFPGREWHTVLRFVEDGKLDLSTIITHCVGLEQILETLIKMDKREFDYGKVIVEI